MALLFHVILIIAIDSVFCIDQINIHGVTITTNENFTLIECNKDERKSLEKLPFPARKLLSLKDDIRFRTCDITNSFSISNYIHNLGVKVIKKLTFDAEYSNLVRYNLAGLETLTHLTIVNEYRFDSDPNLLQDLPNLEFLCLNHFNYATENFFTNLSKLKSLEIYGYVDSINQETFSGLINLINLKLKLDIYHENAPWEKYGFIFDGLMSLKSLSISDDILLCLPAGAFKKLKNLEYVEIFCEGYDYKEW